MHALEVVLHIRVVLALELVRAVHLDMTLLPARPNRLLTAFAANKHLHVHHVVLLLLRILACKSAWLTVVHREECVCEREEWQSTGQQQQRT